MSFAQKISLNKLLKLLSLFTALAIVFWTLKPGGLIWQILMLCAILWFLIELYHNKTQTSKLKKSFLVGLFLMLFDFVVENSGKIAGLWEGYNSLFFVLYVPAEVMILCLVGGMAWALYLPERFDEVHSICDILLFSTFGALGEFILIKNGILAYMGGWTSIHAFMGYAVTWMILHALNYRIIKMK